MAGRPVHTFEVVRSEQLAPHLVRVILGGGGFDTFKPNDFTDAYVKIVFVKDGVDPRRGRRPLTHEQLRDLHPHRAAAGRAHLTVRCVDEDRREVAIDIVVHGDRRRGPGRGPSRPLAKAQADAYADGVPQPVPTPPT